MFKVIQCVILVLFDYRVEIQQNGGSTEIALFT